MHRLDYLPRLSVHRWAAPIPYDETEAGGWCLSFAWLGVLIELGAGRRTRFWREHPHWVNIMREIAPLPMAEQRARLIEMEARHG